MQVLSESARVQYLFYKTMILSLNEGNIMPHSSSTSELFQKAYMHKLSIKLVQAYL